MTDDQPLVSIILSIFNKEKTIKHLLKCLRESSKSYKNIELHIIFDGCIDDSRIITEHELLSFEAINVFLYTRPNIFETRSNNLGLKNANGKYCVLIQDDNFIYEKYWIEQIVSFFEANLDVAIVGGLAGAYFYPLNYCVANKKIHFSENEIYERVDPAINPDIYKKIIETDTVMRGPLFIKKDLLERYGYLDEIFAPLYNDDMDLCFRLRSKGYKVFLYPIKVENKCLSLQDYSILKNQTWKYLFKRNQTIFYDRWEYLMTNDKSMYKTFNK